MTNFLSRKKDRTVQLIIRIRIQPLNFSVYPEIEIIIALTRKVDTLATSLPHVSAIISKVKACVPTSRPLFTKISNGNASSSNLGCKETKVFLINRQGRGRGGKGFNFYITSPDNRDVYVVADLNASVGIAKRITSTVPSISALGRSGPTAVMQSGNTCSVRYFGFL